MKFLFFFFILLGVLFSCFSQTKVKLDELKDHIGDSVVVEGSVSGTRYLENADRSPTFLNIGGAYPKNLLTIVIWITYPKKFYDIA
jgi:hypothetical protein